MNSLNTRAPIANMSFIIKIAYIYSRTLEFRENLIFLLLDINSW